MNRRFKLFAKQFDNLSRKGIIRIFYEYINSERKKENEKETRRKRKI